MSLRSRVRFPGACCVSVLALAMVLAACNRGTPPTSSEVKPPEVKTPVLEGRKSPWLKNLGKFERKISTSSPEAQHYFNQGLTLYYGFNHQEAARSFQEVARLDPVCSMGFWGEALSLGPNINDSFPDAEREQKAYAAMKKALELRSGSSPAEQALIDALSTRYTQTKKVDRKKLNTTFARAMTSVFKRFGDDPDVATLYAESVMDTMPWAYWKKDGTPQPGTKALVAALESVIAKFPDHPGANHLYIHAVEASPDPDRAVPSADRLGGLVPAAGHLVHMPSHIYIRVGRYEDAAAANRRAILADEDYITQCRVQGFYPVAYYPHNIHFLSSALSMAGQADEAIAAARKAASKMPHEKCGMQGLGFVHLLKAYPLFALVRFGHWDDILRETNVKTDSHFVNAMQHFARGLAFNAKSEPDKAEIELADLQAARAHKELATLKISDQNSLLELCNIATDMLAGEMAAKRKNWKSSLGHLRRGVAHEDALVYSEPPIGRCPCGIRSVPCCLKRAAPRKPRRSIAKT